MTDIKLNKIKTPKKEIAWLGYIFFIGNLMNSIIYLSSKIFFLNELEQKAIFLFNYEIGITIALILVTIFTILTCIAWLVLTDKIWLGDYWLP